MFSRLRFVALALALATPANLPSQALKEKQAPPEVSKDEAGGLELKDLFPKKGLFGPSARSAQFSADGLYAAFLWRPHVERRHGSDLYLFEVATGELRRVTSAAKMKIYRKTARKVTEHRVEAAKKAGKEAAKKTKDEMAAKKGKKGKKDSAAKRKNDKLQGDDENFIAKDDHKNKKDPKWDGVSSFKWAPDKSELIFSSGGDLYRFQAKSEAIERLTATRSSSERGYEYTPDGEGFVFREEGIRRVKFGSHFVEEIDPKLAKGESLSAFRLSPDGKKLVIRASKGARRSGSRHVKIAQYRKRFMDVKEVPRTVSDDPIGDRETSIYVVEIGDSALETSRHRRTWSHKLSGPRDVLNTPSWSLDSKKLVFVEFDQKTEKVRVVQVDLEPKTPKKPAAKETAKADDDSADEDKTKKDDSKAADKKKKKDELAAESRVVYEFSHDGGPNTPRMMRPYFNRDGTRIVILSEQSGFRHIHLIDPLYESCDQLTHGHYEVYPVAISKDHRQLYVTATKEDSTCQDLYSIEIDTGTMVRLSSKRGVYNDAAVSANGLFALANFQCFGQPKELVFLDVEKSSQRKLTDSHPESTLELTRLAPEFFSFKNRHGHRIHGHVFKPDDWTDSDKRPLLLYVYGGPLGTRKQVTEGNYHYDSYFLAMYMAKKHGWVTATIDPRGMSGYGGAFEKANFEQVGKPQVEDLVDGAHFLCKEHGVDEKKMALHGWSFGGFQTQMCLYTEPDVFAVGIAGAGPTEWENYNSWYSTGTIGKSREGTPDLKKYSLLPLAKNLKSKLLLVHGMEDSNVLYQDTVRVYRELLKADKETLVELFLDPTGGHGLGGDIQRLNRARKYEAYLLQQLGKGPQTKPQPPLPTSNSKASQEVDNKTKAND